jgi:hypothetical protein
LQKRAPRTLEIFPPTPTNSEREVVKKEKEEDTFFQVKTRRKETSS